MRARFAGEQEHIIIVEDTDGNLLREFSVYSLLPDWYGLLPFKGLLQLLRIIIGAVQV